MKKVMMLALPVLVLLGTFFLYDAKADNLPLYADVAGNWAAEDILRWCGRGVLSGSEGRFRPDEHVPLAQLATVFTRLLPLEEEAPNRYEELDPEQWYTSAILKCIAAGILDAEPAEPFKPLDALRRDEALTMTARAFGLEPKDPVRVRELGYAGRLREDEQPWLEAALEAGLTRPEELEQLYLTRAELAALLSRLEAAGLIA